MPTAQGGSPWRGPGRIGPIQYCLAAPQLAAGPSNGSPILRFKGICTNRGPQSDKTYEINRSASPFPASCRYVFYSITQFGAYFQVSGSHANSSSQVFINIRQMASANPFRTSGSGLQSCRKKGNDGVYPPLRDVVPPSCGGRQLAGRGWRLPERAGQKFRVRRRRIDHREPVLQVEGARAEPRALWLAGVCRRPRGS